MEKVKIFYSYSHADSDLRKKLDDHLAFLKKSSVTLWYDRELFAGQEFDKEIRKELENADIILLLISSNFLSSFYCYEVEMKMAMERHDNNKAVVVPVLLSDCVWQDAPFSKLLMSNEDAKPIDNPKYWNTINEALTNVAQNLKRTVSWVIEKKSHKESSEKEKNHVDINILIDYPLPNSLFTGRVEELKKFNVLFEKFNLLAIQGLGGVGKTEFVSKFIDEFIVDKEKVIWLNGTTESKFDAFIENAGCGELLKVSDQSSLALFSGFKDKLEKTGKIVFLDNFQSLADTTFSDFIEYCSSRIKSSKIIIVTKSDPSIIDTKIVTTILGGLEDDALIYAKKLKESYEQKYLNVKDSDLKLICESTEGHPLAIQLAMQLITYGMSAQNVVHGITKYRGRKDVEALSKRLFIEMYEHTSTTDEERELLKNFSVFKDKVDLDSILYIMDNKNVTLPLSNLIDKLLITYSNNYYSTHPLIREFSHELITNKEKVHEKAANYYINQRTENLNPYLEEQVYYHLSQSNQWHKIESDISDRGNKFILSGQLSLVLDLLDKLEKIDIHKPVFDLLKGDVYQLYGNWNNALHYFKKCSDQNIEFKIKAEGTIRYGEILVRRGDYKDALSFFENALAFSINNNLLKEKARALNDIGLVFQVLGESVKASEMFHDALKIRASLGDQLDIATSLNNIGIQLFENGRFEEALEKHFKSLEIKKKIGDKLGIADSIMQIGYVHHERNQQEEAQKKFEEALRIRQEVGDKAAYSKSLVAIGKVFFAKKKHKEAIRYYKDALDIAKEIGDKDGIATSLNNIGAALFQMGEIEKSLKFHKQSLEIIKETGNKYSMATSLNNIASILKDKGDLTEAIKMYKQSIEINTLIGKTLSAALTLSNLGAIYADKKLKQFEEALYCLLKSLALYNQIKIHDSVVWNHIITVRDTQIDRVKFKQIVNQAYEKIEQELKQYIPLNEICNEPIKVERKLGRNDPCHCNSGKKYKNCHGKTE